MRWISSCATILRHGDAILSCLALFSANARPVTRSSVFSVPGVWAALSALAEKTASTRGCQAITINTVPSRFQGMYSYLTSPESGFRELGREMREENGEPYEKVKFIKDLP